MGSLRFRICFSMKRERKMLHGFLRVTGLGQDLDPHRFYLQWYGTDECVIERHLGILCFEDTRVRLKTEQGVLTVAGENLSLFELTATRAKVTGRIESLIVEGKS